MLFLCTIMKQLSYAEKLKSPKWQKKRLEIFNRDKFTCRLCGDTKTQLHVHHIEYDNSCEPWECKNDILVTLCEDCHLFVESIKEENVPFKDISIYKSNDWDEGVKIMFVHYGSTNIMDIYNKENYRIVGFNMSQKVVNGISDFLKKKCNG